MWANRWLFLAVEVFLKNLTGLRKLHSLAQLQNLSGLFPKTFCSLLNTLKANNRGVIMGDGAP
jgi:hypothetical protein